MVKVIQVADDGTEVSSVEVDDYTIEVLYSGIAEMLRDAAATAATAASPSAPVTAWCDLPRQARQRRDKVLTRIRD